MTAIKQVSITTPEHEQNLAKYLNNERALACSSQNITNENNWEKEMRATRIAYGHDKPSRAGATNTIMYHQVLAFNPDECSCNGGVVTPEFAMEYARSYIQKRYPNQEAIWVLHKEHCKNDDISRYAVHIGINRTNLETGKRLNEGRSQNAKIARANTVRDLDASFGLKQMVAGERNSRLHARQETKQEKEMRARGIKSDKQYIREAIRVSVKEVNAAGPQNKVRALSDALDAKGVKMSVSKNKKNFVFERRKSGRKINGIKLGRGFSMRGIVGTLGMEINRQLEKSVADE